jgi:alpha-tubulin suppressor-like RCC1 family protein
VPVPVTGLSSGIAAIAAGFEFSCALTTAGGVKCWGINMDGELGNNTAVESTVPVPVSNLSSGVVAIATGGRHACALTTAGGVLCWGSNFNGELGNGSTATSLVPVAVPTLTSGVAAVTAGDAHTCVLTTAGALLCWGGNFSGQCGYSTSIESHVPASVLEP